MSIPSVSRRPLRVAILFRRRHQQERALETDLRVRRLHHHQPVDLVRRRKLARMPNAGRAISAYWLPASSRSSARSSERFPKNGHQHAALDFVVADTSGADRLRTSGWRRRSHSRASRRSCISASQDLRETSRVRTSRRRSRARTGVSRAQIVLGIRPLAPARRDDQVAQALRARAVGDFERRMAADRAQRQARAIVLRRAPGRRILSRAALFDADLAGHCARHDGAVDRARRSTRRWSSRGRPPATTGEGDASKIDIPPLPSG